MPGPSDPTTNFYRGLKKPVRLVLLVFLVNWDRYRFSTDKGLEMTTAVKGVFQHAFTQGELEIVGIVDISEAEDGQSFDVKVDWVGFDEGERS